ncbi:hypothetical protein BDF21DRAFT_360636 [Thamnidium elegans]|nr:hypothetical protein BDF21DRAFT_360636 [Thamnidium elegans]
MINTPSPPAAENKETKSVVEQPTSPPLTELVNTPSPSSPDIPTPTFVPHMDQIMKELIQKNDHLRRLNDELAHYKRANADLAEKERMAQERMVNRKKDQKQLLDNYNEHIRSRRATSDDVNSIHRKLKELKAMIKSLSIELGNKCDPVVAGKSIGSFWVNLNEAIVKLGDPLPLPRVIMLTEKFLMDVLVQNMNYNTFTGLKISQPYTQLQMWFEKYDPSFCTRLRQEMAKVVVSGNEPNSDIQLEILKLNRRMYASLYSSLLKAYPFIEQHDANEKDNKKLYSTQLRMMVDQASNIGYAMRGQEVEIAAAAVDEGTENFDPKTMIDEDGQTSGIIQFCVCPPFIVYGARVELLEKARVLCKPLPINSVKS